MATIFGQNISETIFGNPEADTINGWDILNPPGDEGPADDNDDLLGDTGNDTINGGNGNDRLWGQGDEDTLNGGAGLDQLMGGFGTDTLNGGEGADSLFGEEDTDTLNGDNGNDDLIGGAGVDTMNGGADDDRLWGGTDSDIINGGTGNDKIYINSGEGFDAIDGGADIDLVAIDRSLTSLGVSFSIANSTVLQTLADGTSLINIEQLVYTGGSGNDTVTGGALLDDLRGGAGLDTLDGGGGNDVVLGGADVDNISGNTGDDDVRGDEGADIVHGGGDSDQVYGGVGDDDVFGDTGDDFLFVSANEGNDNIDGGTGSDYLYFDRTGSALGLTISLANPALLQILGDTTTIVNIERIWFLGGSGADNVTGGALGDVLYGGAGGDTLNGLDGIDTMSGGDGSDTYFANVFNDVVSETSAVLATGGNDLVNFLGTAGTFTLGLNIERLTLSGTAAINGTGNALANTITGNAAANVLNGGIDTLADTLTGGLGNDTYVINSVNDNIVEAAGQGIQDRALASVSFTLGAGDNVEILQTTNTAGLGSINLTGNETAQIIYGNAGTNTLNGGIDALVDTLVGGLGNDTYIVNSAGDNVYELLGQGTGDRVLASVSFTLGAGDNIEVLQTSVTAGLGAINLTGNEIAQTVIGNAGSNVINGGLGNDVLTGWLGNDFFVFNTAPGASTNRDTITDYNVAADTIRLENTGIFTALGVATGVLNVALFKNLTTGGVVDANDRILYNDTTGQVFYDTDGSGAAVAIQFATITGAPTLTNLDFVVI